MCPTFSLTQTGPKIFKRMIFLTWVCPTGRLNMVHGWIDSHTDPWPFVSANPIQSRRHASIQGTEFQFSQRQYGRKGLCSICISTARQGTRQPMRAGRWNCLMTQLITHKLFVSYFLMSSPTKLSTPPRRWKTLLSLRGQNLHTFFVIKAIMGTDIYSSFQ